MVKVTKGEVKGKKKKAVKLKDGTLVFDANKDVEDILYSSYAEKLQTGTVSQKTWLSSFVNTTLDSLATAVSTTPEIAPTALREINKIANNTQVYANKKKTVDVDFACYLLRKMLFPWQIKFFDDKCNKITLLAGRRAGKSYSIVKKAIAHCVSGKIKTENGEKKRQAVIIGLTFEKTCALYWDAVKDTIEKCHIPFENIDNGACKVVFSNGNELFLYGNNSRAEREKLRGFDVSFVAIDECQSQQALLYLYESILAPQLKGTKGEIVLAGTAPLVANTFWERAINDTSYSHFHATMENNPSIPDYQNALKDVLEENHWTEDNITYRREYLGEIAYDTERMIYPSRYYYTSIPQDFRPIGAVIGLDYGWRDYSSFAPIVYDEKGQMYLVHEWKQNKTASSELVKVANEIKEKLHKEFDIPYSEILFVADSSHQQISQDMQNRGINIQNAYKFDENYRIAQVAEALAVQDLYIKKDEPFDVECNQLCWKFNDERGSVVYQIDEDVFHPDIADSVKYAVTQIRSQGYLAQ